jgi:hypothetical protein
MYAATTCLSCDELAHNRHRRQAPETFCYGGRQVAGPGDDGSDPPAARYHCVGCGREWLRRMSPAGDVAWQQAGEPRTLHRHTTLHHAAASVGLWGWHDAHPAGRAHRDAADVPPVHERRRTALA